MKKKNKAQKLTKEQLKKLRGGLTFCYESKCIGDTCGGFGQPGENRSEVHCSGNDTNTVSIAEPSGGNTPIKGRK